MTDLATDPFASTSDDPFATPTTDFVTIDDVDGRLIAVVGKEIRSRKGNNGEPYDFIVADVIVVDGPVSDKIPSLPYTIADMHISASMVVGQIRAHVAKRTPVLGRVNSKPSSFNRNVKAYALGDPTDQDKGKALPAYRAYMAAQASETFGG